MWERSTGAGRDERGRDERHTWHVYHVDAIALLPERWTHRVRAAGPEEGLRFVCHRLPLTAESAKLLHPLFVLVIELARRAATEA